MTWATWTILGGGPVMAIDPEGAQIPLQAVLGLCVDCDETRETDKNGRCVKCGSDSVIRRNAIKAVRNELQQRAAEKIRRERELEELEEKLRQERKLRRAQRREMRRKGNGGSQN